MTAAIALTLCLDASPARAADDAAAAPPPVAASADDIRAAEIKVRPAEIDYLQAKIELAQLKSQTDVAKLQEQADAAQAALTVLNGAQAEAEGFLRKWLVLGPVAVDEKVGNNDEESCKEMLDRAYVPADAAPRDGDKATIDGAELSWKQTAAADFYVDLSKFAEDAGKEPEKAAYLGVVYVTSPDEAAGVKLAIGSDDGSVWRLNGKEVLRSYEGRAVDKDQNTAEGLTLKKGVNVLSFTVLNGEGPAAAAARFLDKDGDPLKGLTASLTPPAK